LLGGGAQAHEGGEDIWAVGSVRFLNRLSPLYEGHVAPRVLR
jgi:hypothetical protein